MSAPNQDDRGEDTAEEWVLDIKGTKYIVSLVISSKVLNIQVEDDSSGDRWSADFSSEYIEDLTQKAGSFKKFAVFVSMLVSAFNKDSESVYVELLSLAELELLHPRRSSSSTRSSRKDTSSKRYMILTYTGEFDRVHFPLALAFEETPNPVALLRTIRRLRQQIVVLKQEKEEPTTEREKELRAMLAQVRQENTELKHRLRQSKASQSSALSSSLLSLSPGAISVEDSLVKLKKEHRALQKELARAQHELQLSAQLLQQLKEQHAAEKAKWQHRIGGVSSVDAVSVQRREQERAWKQREETMAKKIMRLEQEIKLWKLTRGSQTANSARSQTPLAQTRSASARRSGSAVARSASPSMSRGSERDRASASATSSSLGGRFNPTAYVQSRGGRHGTPTRQSSGGGGGARRERTPSPLPAPRERAAPAATTSVSATVANKRRANKRYAASASDSDRESGYSSADSARAHRDAASGSGLGRTSRAERRVQQTDSPSTRRGSRHVREVMSPSSDEEDAAPRSRNYYKSLGVPAAVADTSRGRDSALQKATGAPRAPPVDMDEETHSDRENRRVQQNQREGARDEAPALPLAPLAQAFRHSSATADERQELRTSRELRGSKEQPTVRLGNPASEPELTDLDQRIQALQHYLDNARVGLSQGRPPNN